MRLTKISKIGLKGILKRGNDMSNYAWVLMLHYEKEGKEECRILDLYYNKSDGEKIKDAINANYYAEKYEGETFYDAFPNAPKASLIRRRLIGEDYKLISIYKKIDKLTDEISTQAFNLRRHAKNVRPTKKHNLLDRIWGI